MADLLYLVHRLPYPPNKGDKVRSYHLLEHLAARHRVHLGTFVDDPDDLRHVEAVRSHCASMHVARLFPAMARLRSLRALVTGAPLTVAYYADAGLAAWVRETVRREPIRDALVFASSMAQYVDDVDVRVLLDCVDVDSAKWSQYAETHAWPLSALYRREGRRLLTHEVAAVNRSAETFFVTASERELFARLAPGCAEKATVVGNGVDADRFSPDGAFASPFAHDEEAVVFTGAMDYWPNADAVRWFAEEVLPALRERRPRARFYIVGMRPNATVRALASEVVSVTGTVPDVRPYLMHAAVVVAPLRIARGVQNKILEAMAMARPVVASRACAAGIDCVEGRDLCVASDATEFVDRIGQLLANRPAADAMGAAARECVLQRYSWHARLRRLDELIDGDSPPQPAAATKHATKLRDIGHAAV